MPSQERTSAIEQNTEIKSSLRCRTLFWGAEGIIPSSWHLSLQHWNVRQEIIGVNRGQSYLQAPSWCPLATLLGAHCTLSSSTVTNPEGIFLRWDHNYLCLANKHSPSPSSSHQTVTKQVAPPKIKKCPEGYVHPRVCSGVEGWDSSKVHVAYHYLDLYYNALLGTGNSEFLVVAQALVNLLHKCLKHSVLNSRLFLMPDKIWHRTRLVICDYSPLVIDFVQALSVGTSLNSLNNLEPSFKSFTCLKLENRYTLSLLAWPLGCYSGLLKFGPGGTHDLESLVVTKIGRTGLPKFWETWTIGNCPGPFDFHDKCK